MQRVGTLIDKLQELYRKDGDVNGLLLTAQMLVNELSTQINETAVTPATVHASVMLPHAVNIAVATAEVENKVTVAEQPEVFELEVEPQPEIEAAALPDVLATPEPEAGKAVIEPAEAMATEQEETPTPAPVTEPTAPQMTAMDFFNGQQWLFDMQTEVPTLAQQPSTELNPEAESLNDKLKVERKELGSVLKEAPIKDLKKAIGINDRYQFINELFRGDENMFERSLKTINSFNVFSEAEYWIKRELKLKLGWNEESEIVMHFDQLVRRRFL